MNMQLKLKYLMRADDHKADGKVIAMVKGGRGAGHGSSNSGNQTQRRMRQRPNPAGHRRAA